MRLAAARTLGPMGADAAEAITPLANCYRKERVAEVRRAAEEAMRAIERKKAAK
jgi:hypothetical protein